MQLKRTLTMKCFLYETNPNLEQWTSYIFNLCTQSYSSSKSPRFCVDVHIYLLNREIYKTYYNNDDRLKINITMSNKSPHSNVWHQESGLQLTLETKKLM